MNDRFEEIAKKIQELDSLIEATLDNEPICSAVKHTYGKRIIDLFDDTAWIEPCIGWESGELLEAAGQWE